MTNKKKIIPRYTSEEDSVIIQEINKCPLNISEGISNACKLLPRRTLSSISVRYYSILKKKSSTKALTTGSHAGFSQNVKNLKRDKDGNMPPQNLNKIMWLLECFLSVSPREQSLFLEVLKG